MIEQLPGELVDRVLHHTGAQARLLAMMGRLLLREERDFHTIQTVEAAFGQHHTQRHPEARVHMLVAAARYLAAHAPAQRSQGQTYEIAYRLHRGDRLFLEE